MLVESAKLCSLAVVIFLGGCFLLTSPPEPPNDFGVDAETQDATPDALPDQVLVEETASLSGLITRSVEPQNGGVGHIYVAVLKDNPITSIGARIERSTVIPNADMREAGVEIRYSIHRIPIRSEPYYVMAFLDDDSNASIYLPMPSAPDLITVQPGSAALVPMIGLDSPADFELDLDLNLILH